MGMAGRNFDNQQTLERQIKDVHFKFSHSGGTFTKVLAKGVYAVTREGAGEYKIELEDKWIALRDFEVSIIDSTARDYSFQIKAYDMNPVSGKAYITFYSNTAATPTDLSTCTLLGKLTLKNTSVF